MESEDRRSAGGPVLTTAQMRFAREPGARPGFARVRDGSVFFYRDDHAGTERWLVDCQGDVLDVAYLPRGAARARQRDPASREPGRDTS